MGPVARRFVAGYDICALRRHLDSVPPETPIRESHADTGARRIMKPGPERTLPVYTMDDLECVLADQMMAAVTAPPPGTNNLEVLI